MSNGEASDRRGGRLVIVLALLVPLCFVGWLVRDRLTHGPESGPPRAAPALSDDPGTAPAAVPKTPPKASAASGPPLTGTVVLIDPGHNPGNRERTADINRLVDIGTNRKACDTTGTATDGGYPEAEFTLDVSRRVRELLEARGAEVVLTQDDDLPFGPCVDERARIGNEAHADAAVSVHADGSAAGNRGFHVIVPKAVHKGGADTRAIAGPSLELGTAVMRHFAEATGASRSDYLGGGTGMTFRDDLGGLNLSTVPKIFIECGNMRDPQDAAELTDHTWRQHAADGIADGITDFLTGKR